MRLPTRDVIATGLVAFAALLYGLWAVGAAPPGLGSARAVGAVVLALGFAASASAVVPTFEQLLGGSKTYLAVTSLVGVLAVIGGVRVLVAASDAGLAVVMAAMIGLWLIATIHHMLLAKSARPASAADGPQPASRGPRPAGAG